MKVLQLFSLIHDFRLTSYAFKRALQMEEVPSAMEPSSSPLESASFSFSLTSSELLPSAPDPSDGELSTDP